MQEDGDLKYDVIAVAFEALPDPLPHPKQSEHLEAYLAEMNKVQEQVKRRKIDFEKDNIHYHPRELKEFNCRVIEQLNRYQIVVLKVQIGWFTLEIKILNSGAESPLSRKMIACEGVFSRIYLMLFGGREIIVKSSEYASSSGSKTASFHRCVQDYCISKICWAMGCGPTILQSFGFDLIVFRKTIEFSMEKCSHGPKFGEEEYLQLLENLGVMHQYHIIHRDITPNNIMFSPSQGKNIFIDFNVSTIIGENTGEKTYTSFQGTPSFVLPQMLRLLSIERSYGFVDLYYNDLVGLIKSKNIKIESSQQKIRHFRFTKIRSELQKDVNPETRAENEYKFILFTYECYFSRLQAKKMFKVERDMLLHHFKDKIVQLFSKLPLSMLEPQVANFIFYPYSEELKNYMATKARDHICALKKEASDSQTGEQISSVPKYIQDKEVNQLRSQDNNSFSDKTEEYPSLFQNLRFDKKNMNILQKKNLAQKLSPMERQCNPIDSENEISAIKRAFKQMLRHCLYDPSSKWVIENSFSIIVQAIMTDTDIFEELEAIQKSIIKSMSFEELFTKFWEFFHLQHFSQMKCRFEDKILGFRTITKIKLIFKKLCTHISYIISLDQDEMLVSNLCSFICDLKKNPAKYERQVYEKFNLLQGIRKTTLKNQIGVMILMQYLSSPTQLPKREALSQTFLEFVQPFKSVLTHFVHSILWNLKIVRHHLTKIEKNSFLNQIKQTINHDTIYQNFQFKFLQNSANNSEQYMEELISICFEDRRLPTYVPLLVSQFQVLSKKVTPQTMIELIGDTEIKFYSFLEENIHNVFEIDFKKRCKISDLIADPTFAWKVSESSWPCLFNECFKMFRSFQDSHSPIRHRLNTIFCKTSRKLLKKQILSPSPDIEELENYCQIEIFSADNPSESEKQEKFSISFDTFRDFSEVKHLETAFHNLLKLEDKSSIISQTTSSRISKLYLKLHQHVMLHNLVTLAYVETTLDFDMLVKRMLVHLVQRQAKSQVYQLLEKLMEVYSTKPLRVKEELFIANLDSFLKEVPYFFVFSEVKQEIGQIRWQNRNAIILYALALRSTWNRAEVMSIMVLIVKNINNLSLKTKEIILKNYFPKLMTFNYSLKVITCDKMQSFVLLRRMGQGYFRFTFVKRQLKKILKRISKQSKSEDKLDKMANRGLKSKLQKLMITFMEKPVGIDED